MLYPRFDGNGGLVSEDQMVGWREHLTQSRRIVFFTGVIGARCLQCGEGEVDSHNLLLALDSTSSEPIKLVITSPGGGLDHSLLFYDTMKMLRSPIETIGRFCASGATLLLAAGKKRYLFPHSKVMLHLAYGQGTGDVKDIAIQHKQMVNNQETIINILLECGVKRSREEILVDIDRDFWLSAPEAIEYGLADEILTPEIWRSWMEEIYPPFLDKD